jgi:hypothetical protein
MKKGLVFRELRIITPFVNHTVKTWSLEQYSMKTVLRILDRPKFKKYLISSNSQRTDGCICANAATIESHQKTNFSFHSACKYKIRPILNGTLNSRNSNSLLNERRKTLLSKKINEIQLLAILWYNISNQRQNCHSVWLLRLELHVITQFRQL